MKGEALAWINTIETNNYNEMRREFLNKFWNGRIQRNIVDFILDGRYDWKKETSLEGHFRK